KTLETFSKRLIELPASPNSVIILKIPDDWEQELMLHSWKMMKITQHQRMNYENFYLNIYEFPNGLKIDCRPQGLRIYINIEFSGMVERIIDNWECKKKDCKGNETCIYHLSGKSKAGVKQLRKDLEDLLWDLYSLGS
ncbi:MAG: hypothetical protein KAU48_08000, partial [Candidatus Thorarchaeota archaeon]|nr:hypothetical protein [Candidatus Thorarchaeota archaeon]